MQLPTLESGTSVAPRQRPTVQRPKGSSQLPLVAPPSPSPRNNLSSPVPPSLSQVDTPSHQVCDQFNAQFQANFPATTPNSATGNNNAQQLPPKLSNLSISNAMTQSFDGATSDKLFESQFPDPFSEEPSTANDIQSEPSETINPDSGSVIVSPTKPMQLLLETPKIGHRRNMSDTSAFNK